MSKSKDLDFEVGLWGWKVEEPVLSFTLDGQISGGKNHIGITRTGHRYPASKNFINWRSYAIAQLIPLRPHTPIDYPVKMVVRYWKSDKRRRDIAALQDSLSHVLEREELITDDVLIEDIEWYTVGLDREKPRVEVQVYRKG